jgi:hypothetical protein
MVGTETEVKIRGKAVVTVSVNDSVIGVAMAVVTLATVL